MQKPFNPDDADCDIDILRGAKTAVIELDSHRATCELKQKFDTLSRSQHAAEYASLILQRLAHRTPLKRTFSDRNDLLELFKKTINEVIKRSTKRKIKRTLTNIIEIATDLNRQPLRTSPQYAEAIAFLHEKGEMHEVPKKYLTPLKPTISLTKKDRPPTKKTP